MYVYIYIYTYISSIIGSSIQSTILIHKLGEMTQVHAKFVRCHVMQCGSDLFCFDMI